MPPRKVFSAAFGKLTNNSMTDTTTHNLKQFDDLGGRLGNLIQRLTSAHGSIQKENLELKKRCTLLEAEKNELLREVDSLRQESGLINGKITELLSKINEWETQLDSVDAVMGPEAASDQQQSRLFS